MANERSNAEVARAFSELADYLEILGENPFKTRAYRNAARTLESLSEPIANVASEGRLGTIPGFGEAIQAKTKDILATGTTPRLEEARKKAPASLLPLLRLPGIGPKAIHQLWQDLGVIDIEGLEKAAQDGRVRDVAGMGEKTEAKILESIDRFRRYSQRILLFDAVLLAKSLVSALSRRPELKEITYAGSVRRGVETIGDIDLVGASTDRGATMHAFTELPQVSHVIVQGDSSTRVVLASGMECDLRLVAPGDFGTLLHHFTGSKAHNIHLREIAERRGLKINEYGIFRGEEEIAAGDDENEIYRVLEMPPIPVHLRENRGEIEAAQSHELPHLIELSHIRGDLHTHTTASDGKATIEEMARGAKERGYEYLAITDHSQSLTVANGLTPDRLRQQIRTVREAGDRYGLHLLAGSEVDIKGDGSMDFPDDLLAELDFVIASVHSRFKQTREELTARVLKAVRNPHVDLIAHPTGRLLNARDPYDIDLEAVIRAAAQTQTALEINSSPERLDLNDVYARMAKDAGVMIAIDTDAHTVGGFELIEFGVIVARRGWLEPANVLNAKPLGELMDWLKR